MQMVAKTEAAHFGNCPQPPGFSEMLLTLIILTLAVVAIICSCAMFVKYLREGADDDGNSNPPPA
jgi:hypothetical protein